jgi:undecaprenyl-diphosphatase
LIESLGQIDVEVFRALNLAGSNGMLDALMVLLTVLGFSYVIILVSIPLWLRKKREAAIDLVILVIAVSVVTELVKILVDRQRPYLELSGVHTLISSSGPSFPSAHASRAFAVAFLLWMNTRRSFGALAFVVAASIAISRVYLGVHWPSDILFGALLGLVLAYLFSHFQKNGHAYVSARRRIIELIDGMTKRIQRSILPPKTRPCGRTPLQPARSATR